MTYAPKSLTTLMSLWTGQGGTNLGIVGDTRHQAKGRSYHLGKSNLVVGAYSALTARDRRGLTEAASAVDLGRLDGTLSDLREFSTWLYQRGRQNAPGTSAIREVIWSPDGKRVLRWDRERGFDSVAFEGEADNSHLSHTHVSFYRDTERADRALAFRPYFELPDTGTAPQEDEMAAVNIRAKGTIRSGVLRISKANVGVIPYDGSARSTISGTVAKPAVRHALGLYEIVALHRDCYLVDEDGKPVLVSAVDVDFVPATSGAPTTDCAPAIAAAITADRASARIVYPPEPVR